MSFLSVFTRAGLVSGRALGALVPIREVNVLKVRLK